MAMLSDLDSLKVTLADDLSGALLKEFKEFKEIMDDPDKYIVSSMGGALRRVAVAQRNDKTGKLVTDRILSDSEKSLHWTNWI